MWTLLNKSNLNEKCNWIVSVKTDYLVLPVFHAQVLCHCIYSVVLMNGWIILTEAENLRNVYILVH